MTEKAQTKPTPKATLVMTVYRKDGTVEVIKVPAKVVEQHASN